VDGDAGGAGAADPPRAAEHWPPPDGCAPRHAPPGAPANRPVAAARARRWEAAGRAGPQAEAAAAPERPQTARPVARTAARHAAGAPIGHRLPPLWGTPVRSQPPRHARRRGLLDPVAWPRVARSQAPVRRIGRGGTPPLPGPGPSHTPRRAPPRGGAGAMERRLRRCGPGREREGHPGHGARAPRTGQARRLPPHGPVPAPHAAAGAAA